MKTNILFAAIAIMLTFCNCKKEDTSISKIEQLHLNGAKTLFFIEEEKEFYTAGTLYMINEANEMEQVEITSDNGQDFYKRNSIENICDINEDYLAVQTDKGWVRCYLIDKKTGTAYDIELPGKLELPSAGDHGDISEGVLQHIDKGYIYAIMEYYPKKHLIRLDISDLSNITYEIISYENDYVITFTADKDGNVVYLTRTPDGHILRTMSFDRKEVAQLPGGSYVSSNYRFRGPDGTMYYEKGSTELTQVTFSPLTVRKYSEENINSGCGYRLLAVENKNIYVAVSSCTSIAHYNFGNASVTNIPHSDFNISEIIMSKSNKNNYFIAYKSTTGSIILTMADPRTLAAKNLIEERYEINDFDVDEENSVFFTAFDIAELKNVLGTVNVNGDITIIKEDIPENLIFTAVRNLPKN